MKFKPKFSFSEMTSNTDGKTSGSGTMGVYICIIGGICFMLGVYDTAFLTHGTDIMLQSIIFVGIGAGLLGYRKSKGQTPNAAEFENDDSKPLNS